MLNNLKSIYILNIAGTSKGTEQSTSSFSIDGVMGTVKLFSDILVAMDTTKQADVLANIIL